LRLKDFDGPSRLFQLVVDGEDADCFTARVLWMSADETFRAAAQIIGREMELAELLRLLAGRRARAW